MFRNYALAQELEKTLLREETSYTYPTHRPSQKIIDWQKSVDLNSPLPENRETVVGRMNFSRTRLAHAKDDKREEKITPVRKAAKTEFSITTPIGDTYRVFLLPSGKWKYSKNGIVSFSDFHDARSATLAIPK